jgi:hypothetical protein
MIVLRFTPVNQPTTIKGIMEATKMPKGSLSLILYKNHADEFESQKTGQGKILAWRLRSSTSNGQSDEQHNANS